MDIPCKRIVVPFPSSLILFHRDLHFPLRQILPRHRNPPFPHHPSPETWQNIENLLDGEFYLEFLRAELSVRGQGKAMGVVEVAGWRVCRSWLLSES